MTDRAPGTRKNAGEAGTAIDVMWYSDQSGMSVLARVLSDGGESDFYDMRMLK